MIKKGIFALVFGAFMVAIALPWAVEALYNAVDYELEVRDERSYKNPNGEPYLLENASGR